MTCDGFFFVILILLYYDIYKYVVMFFFINPTTMIHVVVCYVYVYCVWSKPDVTAVGKNLFICVDN